MIRNLSDLRANLLDRQRAAKRAAKDLPPVSRSNGRAAASYAEEVRARQEIQKAGQVRLRQSVRTSLTGRVLRCGSVGRVVSVRENMLIVAIGGAFVRVPIGSDLVEVVK